MEKPVPMAVGFFALLLALQFHFTSATTATVTATSKEQLECTMCAECDNPCQPPPAPFPPPPEVICPPPPPPPSPPPPPPAALPECPPPPAPVNPCQECQLPPPPVNPCEECPLPPKLPPPSVYPSPLQPGQRPNPVYQPGVVGGAVYGPPNNYFPDNDQNRSPSSSCVHTVHPVSTIFIFLTSLCFFYIDV